MKTLYPRQRQQYIFGGAIAVIALASVLVFLTMYLPARANSRRLEAAIERLRGESASRRQRVDELSDLAGQLDGAREERRRILGARLIPRDEGFARMLLELDALAERTGIRRNRVDYSEPEPQFGVYALRIRIPVQGDYASVTRFIRELENSERLFILESLGLRRPASGDSGTIELSLDLTTYFSNAS